MEYKNSKIQKPGTERMTEDSGERYCAKLFNDNRLSFFIKYLEKKRKKLRGFTSEL